MADDDDRRVEPRGVLVGRGLGVTPEKIAQMQQRAAEIEKLSRPKPAKAFAAVLAEQPEEEIELSEKEKRRRALPKRGPRPGLRHPVQRDQFGRGVDGDDEIIIKG